MRNEVRDYETAGLRRKRRFGKDFRRPRAGVAIVRAGGRAQRLAL